MHIFEILQSDFWPEDESGPISDPFALVMHLDDSYCQRDESGGLSFFLANSCLEIV